MQSRGETDANTCAFNDLALVAIDPRDYAKVSSSVPQFGGPTGLAGEVDGTAVPVFSYGNSILRQGITILSPKYGLQFSTDGDGWSHLVRLIVFYLCYVFAVADSRTFHRSTP